MRTSSRRVVFDANVLVSAFLFPESSPGLAVFRPSPEVVPLISAPLSGELAAVLARPKLDAYVSIDTRISLFNAFISRCERIEITVSIEACRDSRDDHVLELAISGHAEVIVTGDRDLLALDPFRGIRILRPSDFVAEIE